MGRGQYNAILDFQRGTFYKPDYPSLLVRLSEEDGTVFAKGMSKDIQGEYWWKPDNKEILGFSKGGLVVTNSLPSLGTYPILSDGENVFRYGKIALIQKISSESLQENISELERKVRKNPETCIAEFLG